MDAELMGLLAISLVVWAGTEDSAVYVRGTCGLLRTELQSPTVQ